MYGVATISRLLQMIGLICKRALLKRPYSAKETYVLKEPTNYSHPIFTYKVPKPHTLNLNPTPYMTRVRVQGGEDL